MKKKLFLALTMALALTGCGSKDINTEVKDELATDIIEETEIIEEAEEEDFVDIDEKEADSTNPLVKLYRAALDKALDDADKVEYVVYKEGDKDYSRLTFRSRKDEYANDLYISYGDYGVTIVDGDTEYEAFYESNKWAFANIYRLEDDGTEELICQVDLIKLGMDLSITEPAKEDEWNSDSESDSLYRGYNIFASYDSTVSMDYPVYVTAMKGDVLAATLTFDSENEEYIIDVKNGQGDNLTESIASITGDNIQLQEVSESLMNADIIWTYDEYGRVSTYQDPAGIIRYEYEFSDEEQVYWENIYEYLDEFINL